MSAYAREKPSHRGEGYKTAGLTTLHNKGRLAHESSL